MIFRAGMPEPDRGRGLKSFRTRAFTRDASPGGEAGLAAAPLGMAGAARGGSDEARGGATVAASDAASKTSKDGGSGGATGRLFAADFDVPQPLVLPQPQAPLGRAASSVGGC